MTTPARISPTTAGCLRRSKISAATLAETKMTKRPRSSSA
jgi:hypothetical protein